MSKDNKFGTFGGVFTPSILTILGVIMYLRLPWVVGNAGLWMTLGVIAVAHIISVTTGLSISSIATDKNVGAGGPYYIVSRSLGLPIGGTLGLALFVGLSFSISLYVIGFCESFLSFIDLELTPSNVRIAGTITVVLLTLVTLISTAFAIKTQYLILVLIGLSLVSVFLGGSSPAPTGAHVEMAEGGPSLGVIFGIFFPAVTGFTAGVNMSGDLKDPKRAIPGGTMAAIGFGLVVYLALAAFLAYRVDPADMVDNTNVLVEIAWIPGLVIAGIWGATLSSALGSILGAPRILQALSIDSITPRWFGKGHGKTNEPRNALLLAFAIGEGGILIAELDAIARVVSMVFLATYGFLNISSAIESWASPDFRPQFRIPRLVSVIGAVTCILVMIQLDFAAMAGATVLLSVLFLFLKRRQLTLDAGDTWEGIWSSIVRAGLHRLSQGRGQRRNWRPNVLMFSHAASATRPELLDLSKALITGNGLLTDFELVATKQEAAAQVDDDDNLVGVFRRRTVSEDFYETVNAACRHHGFTGLDPNTVLLDWDVDRKDPEKFVGLVRDTLEQDFNLLALHFDPEQGWGERKRVDIWWRPRQGNVALALALMRFLTRFDRWEGAQLRFLLVSEDTSFSDDLLHAMRGVLAEARVDAKVKVVANPSRQHGFENTIRQESSDADLVVLGLPNVHRFDTKALTRFDDLVGSLGTTLLLAGSSLFSEVLPVVGRSGTAAEALARAQASAADLRPLNLPEPAALEQPAATFAERFGSLTDTLFRDGFAPVLSRQEALLDDVRQLVERQFEIMRKGVQEADPARARKPAGRAQGGFLFQARKLVATYDEEVLPSQTKTLQSKLATFIDGLTALASDVPKSVQVQGKEEQFAANDRDTPRLARFKRRRRLSATLRRGLPRYDVPLGALQRWYVHKAATDLLEQWLRSVQSSSHRLAVQLGKILNEIATELSTLATLIERREADADVIETRKAKLLTHVDAAIALAQELAEGTGVGVARRTHETSQAFANDLMRIDVADLTGRERRLERKAPARLAQLRPAAEPWEHHQRLLLHRALLGLQIAAFQHRFAALAHKARTEVTQQLEISVLTDGAKLHASLQTFINEARAGRQPKLPDERELRAKFDGQAVLELLARDVDGCIEDLPETTTTLTDDSIANLESGISMEADEVTVSVRPLVKYLIETEFLDVINQELSGLPLQEQRTVGVARDVVRLLGFTVGDMEAAGGWSNQDFRKQVISVVVEGARRLDTELGVLRTTTATFSGRIGSQLNTLREETAPYALTSRSDSLSLYIRSRGSQQAVSRIRRTVSHVSGYAKRTFVALLYRRSTGVLLARRLRQTAAGTAATVVDRISALTGAMTPRGDLLRALPFYYRQLFSGQATISETFWVGREAELARIKAAVKRHEAGGHGALFVIGETGSGKTALCQVLTAKYLARRPVYRIAPPPGGTIEPSALRLALESEVKERGKPADIVAKAPDGAVFVFDDLEMWWERSERGMAVIEQIVGLLDTHGQRCLFVANLNAHAWRVLEHFVRLSESALAVVECEPLPAETLKSIISLRHGSTGIDFDLDGTPEEELAPWQQARLFTRYFDYSGGLVAVALRAWLAHIDKVDGNTLAMRWPRRPRAEAIEHLRIDLSALLVQMIVHKQVTVRRLQRITGIPADTLDAEIGALTRMGLVRRDTRNVMHVDRFVAHLVADSLRNKGMLA